MQTAMQSITNHLPSSVSAPRRSLANLGIAPSDTTMRTLWIRMVEFYGHKWLSAYGEKIEDGAGSTWQRGLAGVSPAQVADGLRACLSREDPWPPTLPEFRRLCLPPASAQPSPDAWKSARADPAKMPGPKRLAWHVANVEWLRAGGDLPRDVRAPGVHE